MHGAEFGVYESMAMVAAVLDPVVAKSSVVKIWTNANMKTKLWLWVDGL